MWADTPSANKNHNLFICNVLKTHLQFDHKNGRSWGAAYLRKCPQVDRHPERTRPFSRRKLNSKITKSLRLGGGDLGLILECFNLFNTTNYDVNTVDNALFLIKPVSGNMASVPNARFGEYLDTLSPREVQLGVRYAF